MVLPGTYLEDCCRHLDQEVAQKVSHGYMALITMGRGPRFWTDRCLFSVVVVSELFNGESFLYSIFGILL